MKAVSVPSRIRLAAGCRRLTLLFGLATLWAGCATQPAPLPEIAGEGRRDWLSAMAASPVPGPFRATLRIRVKAEGHPAIGINGALSADLPRRLRMNAQVGPFRPVFALLADPDSCELLLHERSGYWITPRSEADWRDMSPGAWVQALLWAFSPGSLFRALEPEGGGEIRQGLWSLRGEIRGTGHEAEIVVDPRRSRVERLDILLGSELQMSCRLSDYRSFREDWLPGTVELILPGEKLRMRVELVRMGKIDAAKVQVDSMIRPPRWRPVRDLLPVAPGGS